MICRPFLSLNQRDDVRMDAGKKYLTSRLVAGWSTGASCERDAVLGKWEAATSRIRR